MCREKTIQVHISSREDIEKIYPENIFKDKVVISFYDPVPHYNGPDYKPVDYTNKSDKVFYVPLRDIDIEILPDYKLTYDTYFPESEELAKFIYDAAENRYSIICQCEFGQSRSAGCAAASREHFFGDGIKVFSDYRYYPNQMVYHKVFEALEAEKRRRLGLNEDI